MQPLRTALRCLAVAGFLFSAAPPLWAQVGVPMLERSAAERCLTPPPAERGRPEYPPDELERRDGGRVRIELVFTAPDRAPRMRLLEDVVNGNFVAAVRRHIGVLRVPCMLPGTEPVRLVQTYSFVPNDGRTVMASMARSADRSERDAHFKCLTRIVPGDHPEYPMLALRREAQGKFFARMTFASPTSPPSVSFAAGPEDRSLRQSIEDYALGFRMPCMAGEPVSLLTLYSFILVGGERTRLKDQPLVSYLRNARDLQLPVFFDFNTMGCPFDLRLRYWAPHQHNDVREIETSLPERSAFIDWLATIALKFDEKTNTEVLGESMTLSVPCGKLDLKAPAAKPASEPPKKE